MSRVDCFPALRLWACLALGIWLALALGCGPSAPEGSRLSITYTFDKHTRELIDHLAKNGENPAYADFDRDFKGLPVPESLLPYEPFVLGLSTESPVPTVLLLDAPWVGRYGVAGWLYELEYTRVYSRELLAPAVAEAFAVAMPRVTGRRQAELVAVPTSIKGNVLFFREDLLERHQVAPPKTWEELRAACQKIMPKERSVKYGLLLHSTNFINDFYPIFWGYGGQVTDAEGHFVLHLEKNARACVAALRELAAMQGSILPAPAEWRRFDAAGALRRAFYQGEALFMINWNTRLHDLQSLIKQGAAGPPGCLTNMRQVGVAPIPCPAGQPHRYANIGSFAWGINRFAVTRTETAEVVGRPKSWLDFSIFGWGMPRQPLLQARGPEIIKRARQFIDLVSNEQFQILAAETLGVVPSLRSALEKVTNEEVNKAYKQAFAQKDMVLRPRPYNRWLNNVLEDHLSDVLEGAKTPEAALQAVLQEYKDVTQAPQ